MPDALRDALRATLERDARLMDEDRVIATPAGEQVPIRIGGSRFHGHTGELMGALVAFSDMTAVRKLEEQVRRTDRLASLGTLSAGMAHEIKNPLVSIQTFAQLLPERFDDKEFRDTFSALIGDEIRRIDNLVTRLLHFARLERPSLSRLRLCVVLGDALRLLDEQRKRSHVRLVEDLAAERDAVMGDADQLSQAFVNFLLNAIEAMPAGGTLTVATAVVKGALPGGEGARAGRDAVRVSIADTGCGIAPANLSRIFDPFFTTKSQGTGLGLAVTHRIIQEHRGAIEVSSAEGKGTRFDLSFPLAEEEA